MAERQVAAVPGGGSAGMSRAPDPGMPRALRWLVLSLAAAGVLALLPTLLPPGSTTAVDRDGALVVLGVAFGALALAVRHRAMAWLAVLAMLGTSLLLAWPVIGGQGSPGEAALRLPFALLGSLAAVAVLLSKVRLQPARLLVAMLTGLALAVILARLLAAWAGDPGASALWPVPRLFVAPAALVLALGWTVYADLRRGHPPTVAAALGTTMAMLGIASLASIGHAIGSPLLAAGVGANPLPLPSALATFAAALALWAAIVRDRAHGLWALLLLGLVALSMLDAMRTPIHDLLPRALRMPPGTDPGRVAISSATFVALVLASSMLARGRGGAWAMRAVQAIGLLAMGIGVVAVSGVALDLLYGVDPLLGSSQLSFLGVLALALAGLAMFLAALARVPLRQARTEAVPALVIVSALATTLALWGGAQRQSMDAIAATGDVALEAMTRTLAAELESRERDLGRLASQLAGDPPQALAGRVQAAGVALSGRYRSLARLAWVSDAGRFDAFTVPRVDGVQLEAAGSRDRLLTLESRVLAATERSARPTFGAARADGGVPRHLALAQRGEGASAGVLLALFVVPDHLLPVVVGRPVPGFGATVEVDGVSFGVVGDAARPAEGGALARFQRVALQPMSGLSVRIAVWPLPATIEGLRSRLPLAILVAGALISALLGLVTVLAGAARERARLAQDSQREIAELLEGLPDAFIAYDRDWRFTHLNRAAEQLSRVRRETVVGRVLWEVSPGARADFGVQYERSMSQRTIERFEVYYARLGLWLSIQSFPLPGGIGVVARDVSAEHRMVDTLRRREADLAQALDMADLARLEMDASERVTWSGAATKVLGLAEEDLPADRAALRRMWHPDDAAALLPLTAEGIASGRGFDLEHRIVLRGGSVRWVHTFARVLTEGPGAPRVVATVQDITERRLQARAVLERDRFFDGSRDLFCILSPGGTFLQVNPALCRLLGYSREELIGRRAFDFTHADDVQRAQDEFRAALRGGARAPSPARARTRDGGARWIQWSSSLSPDGDLYAVGHDVTERLAAETERERTLAALEARNEELQQFAYIASHDLQEPLRKIQAFGDRLGTRYAALLDAEGRDYLARMDNAAKRMSNLIADLLDYSRVSTRGEPFVAVPLSDALGDALGDLEESIRAADAAVEVPPLPVVEGDRGQLAQVFQNLVGNAVKYRHPARRPRIAVTHERFEEPLQGLPGALVPWARVVVSDNGIGFDPVHRERIFAPFQRLHGRSEYAGTGIGLAIVRKIVERHGGRVRADARPGEGATFTVELPLRQPRSGGRHVSGA